MTDAIADRKRPFSDLLWHASAGRFSLGYRALTLLFLAEVLVLALARLPLSLSWANFAFMDEGANLAVQTLLDRGLVPTVDFGYGYGLLPLLIGRLWFGLLGRTPAAYAAAMLVVDFVIAWGLARCIAAMKAGPAGVALVLVAMPWAALASYINLAHAIEATLICHALAEHASGRRSRALSLLTACLFVKPAMAYLYGLFLVLLIVRDAWKNDGVRGISRALAPSAATGLILVALCGCWFGIKPVIESLLPTASAAAYRYMNYGFFRGVGRRFWLPDDVWPTFYLVTPAGHYLVGSVLLAAAAVAALWRLARYAPRAGAFGDEVIACCGIMHVAFVTTFYADFMSWTYYYYVLIIGLAGLAARGGRSAVLILLFAAAALVGNKYQFSWVKGHWRTTRPIADMAGLWTSEAERDEWYQVREIVRNRRAAVLSTQGTGITVLLPGFAPSENMFIVPGLVLPVDLKRKLDQVATAEFVLVRDSTTHRKFLDLWPEFREALDGCELVHSGTKYLLFRRLRPPGQPTNVKG
jgi:hypothetical protein